MVFLLRVHILTLLNADMLVQKGIRPKDALLVAIRQNLSKNEFKSGIIFPNEKNRQNISN